MAWNQGNNGAGCEVQGARKIAQGTKHKAQGTILKGLIAGVVIVLGAVGAFVWLTSGEKPSSAKATEGKKPAKITEGKVVEQHMELSEEKKPTEPEKPKEIPEGTIGKDGRILVKVHGTDVWMTEKEKATWDRANRDTTLRTHTENKLRLLSSVPPGMPVPPMPGSSADIDSEIAKVLENKVEILPDDTEEEARQKQFVIDFKEHIKEEMAQGKKPSEAFDDYVRLMNDIAQFTSTGTRMVRELEAEGDKAGAEMLAEKINTRLDELGAPRIDIHRKGPKGKAQE